jgi:hypothetical protein
MRDRAAPAQSTRHYLRLTEAAGEMGVSVPTFLRHLQEGTVPWQSRPPIQGYPPTVHLTIVAEFRAEFPFAFTPCVLAGVESFTSWCQESYLHLSEPDAAAWLDLIEQTGVTPEGLGMADHYL